MFEMIVMMVKGRNFVTEKFMKSFVVPQKVLKIKGPDVSREHGSQISFFKFTFMAIIMIPMPKMERMNIIGKGSSPTTCS